MSVEDTNSVESSYYDEETEQESVYEKDDAYAYIEEEEEEEDDAEYVDEEYEQKVTKKSKLNHRQPNIINRSSSRINLKNVNEVKDDETIINSPVRKEIVPVIQDDSDEEQEEEEKERENENQKHIAVEENQDVVIEEEEGGDEDEDIDMGEDDIEIPEVSETPMPDGDDVEEQELVDEEEEDGEDANIDGYQISLDINSKESTADIPKRIVRSRMLKDILDYSDSNNKQEEMLTEEEIQLRKVENARKRKNLKDKKLEEEKRDTINKLLKKRAGKARSRQQGNDDDSSRSSPNKNMAINGGDSGNGSQVTSIFQKPRRPYLTDGMIRTVITSKEILYCPRD